MLDTISLFPLFSGLKPKLSKCEVTGIGLLKGVKVAACGLKCIDLTKDAIKILGIFYSYNKNIELEQNFKKNFNRYLKSVENVVIKETYFAESNIIFFKTWPKSKFVFLAQVLPISNEITTTIQRIQKELLWNSRNIKIKHENICNDFQDGSLKNVDMSSKISNLQCSLIKKLYNQNSHDWKLIPLHFTNNASGKNLIFHSNLSFKTSVLHRFPPCYANILLSRKINFSHISYTPSSIGSQFLWFNNYITNDNNSVHFKEFSRHNINFINQLFSFVGEFKDWNHCKR